MTQTLQAIRRPDLALSEMLRVGREAIVTFPNFAYIRNRMQLGLAGHMPVNPQLPNPWYDTPNIHLSTFHDFEELCRALSIQDFRSRYIESLRKTDLAWKSLAQSLWRGCAISTDQGALNENHHYGLTFLLVSRRTGG